MTARRVGEWTRSHISLCQVSLGWGRNVEREQRGERMRGEERRLKDTAREGKAADESKESLM